MNKAIKSFFVPASLLLLSGCAINNPSLNEIKEERVLVIEEVKLIDKTSFQKSESLGIYKDKSLPAFIGPNPSLSADEYTLLKYAEKPLLFNDLGINNYLYLILEQNPESADNKAKEFGYKNTQEMFDHFYDITHYKNSDQLLLFLKFLKEKNLISAVDETIKKDKLESETNKIISTIYSPYYKYEKSEDFNKLNKTWFIYLKKEKVNLNREDYKPYAFTFILLKEVLNSSAKGVKLHGI